MTPLGVLALAFGLAVQATAAVVTRLDFEGGITVSESSATQTATLVGGRLAGDARDAAMSRRMPTLQFEGGDALQRRASVVVDPDMAGNHALEFAIMAPNVPAAHPHGSPKARIQMNVYNIAPAREVYQSVRLRLDDGFDAVASAPVRFGWLTLSEWWNEPGWTGSPWAFRIGVDLENRDAEGRSGLFLKATASMRSSGAGEWSERLWMHWAAGPSLPVRRWIRMETWFREGDERNGRFVIALTPAGGQRQVVMDVTAFTRHPGQLDPDGLSHFNPIKLYTSRALVELVRRSAPRLSLLWDDLEILTCAAGDPAGPASACAEAMGAR